MSCHQGADTCPPPGEESVHSASPSLRAALAAMVGAVCIVTACASAGGGLEAFNRHWEAGAYAAAVQQFRTDSTLRDRERALYRMALLHASPRDTFFEPSMADSLFRRLLELYPETRHRGTVRAFLGVLERMRSREARADSLLAKIEALREISTGQKRDTTGDGS